MRTASIAFCLALAAPVAACAHGDARTDTPAASSAPSITLPSVPSFAALARLVLPAVVNVSAIERAGAPEDDDAEPGSLDDLLRQFLDRQDESGPPAAPHWRRTALGSGFIIGPEGYVVTDAHVIANADRITVVLHDNSRYHARVVGHDSLTDIALLKIDAKEKLPFVSWGDSDAAQIGDWVVAVGNPFGLGGTVSAGILSARGRDIHSDMVDDYLQIDAAINRGNSGGPTFNSDGQVIGVNMAIYSPSGGSVGIAFAIPATRARPVVEQLKAHGKVERGWLGVRLQDMTPELAQTLGLSAPSGALVAGIMEGSPATRSGIRQGDVILSFNGHTIAQMRELPLAVAQTLPGDRVRLGVWRDSKPLSLIVTVTTAPESKPPARTGRVEPPSIERTTIFGLSLAPLSDQWRRRLELPKDIKGVLVTGIADDSPFIDLDLQAGDVIQSVDHNPVAVPQQVAKALRDARSARRNALLLINRDGRPHFIVSPAQEPERGVPGRLGRRE